MIWNIKQGKKNTIPFSKKFQPQHVFFTVPPITRKFSKIFHMLLSKYQKLSQQMSKQNPIKFGDRQEVSAGLPQSPPKLSPPLSLEEQVLINAQRVVFRPRRYVNENSPRCGWFESGKRWNLCTTKTRVARIVKDGQVPGNFAKPVREGRPSETYPITSFPWKRVRLGRATECSCKASAILRVGAEARRIYTERRELER